LPKIAALGWGDLAAELGSGYAPGPGPQLISLTGIGPVLPLICYEAIFPHELNAGFARPALLLQITNDAWFGAFSGPFQHLAQARMRAIEQGLPMVRAANTGVSAVIDGHGRVVAQLALGTAGYLDARLPPANEPTIYSRSGDSPAFLFVLLCAALTFYKGRQIKD
jgi:apolipoprotein N-acyltransferase